MAAASRNCSRLCVEMPTHISSPTKARTCSAPKSSCPTCTPFAPANTATSGRSFTIKAVWEDFRDATSSREVSSNSFAGADLLRYCSKRTPAAASSWAQFCRDFFSKVASSITYRDGRTRRINLLPVRSQQPLDKVRIDFPGGKIGVGKNTPVQRNRGLNTFDHKHLQG